MYGALPSTTLREYLTNYFSGANPRMLMLTDGSTTVGVYGFKEGHVYVMNPEDWRQKYCDSLSEEEKNDGEPVPHLNSTYCNPMDSGTFQPLLKVPVEKMDVTNFCVLQCVVTSKQPQKQKQEGCVSGTDSESDTDQVLPGKVKADLAQVKWTPKLEATLEEILIRNQFDFKLTAKEFQRYLNIIEDGENFFILDGKKLQLRWTDIEIRKHVLPKMKDTKEEIVGDFEYDEELPPLNMTTPEETEDSTEALEESVADTTTKSATSS